MSNKHLNKFENQAAYNAGKYDMAFPAVSLVGTDIIYDKEPIIDYSKRYLTFEALEDCTFSFSDNDLQYSVNDGSTWTTLSVGASTPTISSGNKIIWKQTGLTPGGVAGIGIFSSTGNFNVSGNVMSLYYGDNFEGQTSLSEKPNAFKGLFNNCDKLVSAENLVLPATTLESSCYEGMFWNCTNLTTAPVLLATTLASYCYNQMFYNCTSLTTAPELPATTLASNCYYRMFIGCTSLNSVTCLATDISASDCTSYWLYGVSSTGTFTKAAGPNWPTGASGIPSGWTVNTQYPTNNYLVLGGTSFITGSSGTVIEVGSGYDTSDLTNNPPIIYDGNGNQLTCWDPEIFNNYLSFYAEVPGLIVIIKVTPYANPQTYEIIPYAVSGGSN